MSLEHYLQELAQGEGVAKHSRLVQLSGLNEEEMEQFRHWWPTIPVERRLRVMERLLTVAEDNVELDFSPIFKHCLTDSDATLRERAIAGLWECDERHLVGPLMALLKDDPSEQVRASAATALGKFCDMAEAGKLLARDAERIKKLLLAVVENNQESIEVRRRALESAACFNTTRIPELIKWAYTSPEDKLRLSALYAMGKTGDSAWLPVLLKEMESRDPAVRYEAVSACAELGEEEAVPYLIPLIQDEDSQVQLSAIRALGAIGGPIAKRTLLRCLKSGEEALHEAARDALEHVEVDDDAVSFKFLS